MSDPELPAPQLSRATQSPQEGGSGCRRAGWGSPPGAPSLGVPTLPTQAPEPLPGAAVGVMRPRELAQDGPGPGATHTTHVPTHVCIYTHVHTHICTTFFMAGGWEGLGPAPPPAWGLHLGWVTSEGPGPLCGLASALSCTKAPQPGPRQTPTSLGSAGEAGDRGPQIWVLVRPLLDAKGPLAASSGGLEECIGCYGVRPPLLLSQPCHLPTPGCLQIRLCWGSGLPHQDFGGHTFTSPAVQGLEPGSS